MAKAPFPIIPELTGIAIAYRNRAMIADLVLPRVTPVGKEEFIYLKYDLAQGFTVPDTKVGRRGRVNQVEFTATEETGATKDYGLEDSIPVADMANAPAGIDPRASSTEYIMNLIGLDPVRRGCWHHDDGRRHRCRVRRVCKLFGVSGAGGAVVAAPLARRGIAGPPAEAGCSLPCGSRVQAG